MLPFTDTHAHLSMLDGRVIDSHARLAGLFDAGFGAILDVGTKAGDLAPRLASFSAYPMVFFSAGIWPAPEAIADIEGQMARLEASLALARKEGFESRLVAIGEAGLDRYWNTPSANGTDGSADLAGEEALFRAQAALALRLDLPLIIHSREAPRETMAVLRDYPGLRSVIHCFSYGKEEARAFLDLGAWISFSGTVTFKNAAGQREAAAFVPCDRILLETDAPYLAPVPLRGRPAEPGMVEHSYRVVAAERHIREEELAALVAGNSQLLFGIQREP